MYQTKGQDAASGRSQSSRSHFPSRSGSLPPRGRSRGSGAGAWVELLASGHVLGPRPQGGVPAAVSRGGGQRTCLLDAGGTGPGTGFPLLPRASGPELTRPAGAGDRGGGASGPWSLRGSAKLVLETVNTVSSSEPAYCVDAGVPSPRWPRTVNSAGSGRCPERTPRFPGRLVWRQTEGAKGLLLPVPPASGGRSALGKGLIDAWLNILNHVLETKGRSGAG